MSQGRGIPEGGIEKSRTDDLPRYPDADTDPDAHGPGPERGSSTGPARWVTVVVVVIVALVLLGVVLLHSGGLSGLHGGS